MGMRYVGRGDENGNYNHYLGSGRGKYHRLLQSVTGIAFATPISSTAATTTGQMAEASAEGRLTYQTSWGCPNFQCTIHPHPRWLQIAQGMAQYR